MQAPVNEAEATQIIALLTGTAARRWSTQAPLQEAEATQVIVLLTAIAMMALWQTAIRRLTVLASTAIIAAFGFGLIMFWQTVHHAAG